MGVINLRMISAPIPTRSTKVYSTFNNWDVRCWLPHLTIDDPRGWFILMVRRPQTTYTLWVWHVWLFLPGWWSNIHQDSSNVPSREKEPSIPAAKEGEVCKIYGRSFPWRRGSKMAVEGVVNPWPLGFHSWSVRQMYLQNSVARSTIKLIKCNKW